jgi:hypothetical protein
VRVFSSLARIIFPSSIVSEKVSVHRLGSLDREVDE